MIASPYPCSETFQRKLVQQGKLGHSDARDEADDDEVSSQGGNQLNLASKKGGCDPGMSCRRWPRILFAVMVLARPWEGVCQELYPSV